MQLERIARDFLKIPELVMGSLIDAIDSGKIPVGTELPSERELAEKLGIGRSSLRECLAILGFLGVIEVRGNRKIVTRDADYIQKAVSFVQVSTQPDTQVDFGEFRRINELAVVGLACQRATEENLVSIREVLQNISDDYTDDVRFHDALAIASHNPMLIATTHLINSMLIGTRIHYFDRHKNNHRQIQESHTAIYEAVRAHDTMCAQREMERHLQIVEEFAKKYPA